MGGPGRGDGRRHSHPFPTQTTAGLASLADFFSSSHNADPGPRLQEMEKHNNKETEKKMSYKQCIEAVLHCLRTAIWSPVLHLLRSMLVSHFDSDVLFEWWNLAGAHN